ncbi:hypothetical protein ACJMK2_001313 [Sinanodonta woodiana]|uniref:Protein kinase domain-containing protein n=1 Tax=Sinanodonta woodiana TaxID=1069815 RepID=A0ABD3XVC1_SINWO
MEETEKSWQEISFSNNMETAGPKLPITSVTGQSFQGTQADGSLSPNTSQQLQVIEQHLRSGKAFIVQDDNGRPTIQYERKSKVFRNASKANLITECGTDNDGKKKIDHFLEHVEFLKTLAPPSGIVFDKTQVHTNGGMYREGCEFEKTKKVLGSGTVAGDIVVIEDKTTGMETAQKTIMISDFNKEEIQAWVDLAKTGFAPALYLMKLEGNKVVINMEILSEAKTLRKIIDECLFRINASRLDKPFALHVLDVLLGAIMEVHDKRWTHGDLHPGNVLMQRQSASKLRVRIVDFGMAQPFDGPQGLQFNQFRKDIRQVVRIFSALYCGQEFDDDMDLQRNWRTKLNEIIWLALEDKEELACLIESAMNIAHPSSVTEFQRNVQDRLRSALPDAQSYDDMLRRVIDIIFPDTSDVIALHDHQKKDSAQKSHRLDIADSVVQKPPHSTSVKHQDVAGSRVLVSRPLDVADSVVQKPPYSTSVKHQDVAGSRVLVSRPLDVADSVVQKPPHSTSVKHHDVAGSRVPAFSRETDPLIPEEMLKQIRLSASIKPHD